MTRAVPFRATSLMLALACLSSPAAATAAPEKEGQLGRCLSAVKHYGKGGGAKKATACFGASGAGAARADFDGDGTPAGRDGAGAPLRRRAAGGARPG